MPLQDAIQGEVSAQLPNQVIADISVQTGGFAAEYGNAMSGVVNILTREGRDAFSAGVKLQNESLLNNLTPFAGQPPYNQRVEAKLEGRLFPREHSSSARLT
jgi:outer membrane receptor protein involved in Fe transport